MGLLTGFLVSLLGLSISVNHNNFKKCDQSTFCRRLRNMPKDKSPYFVDKASIKAVNQSSITFLIKHEVTTAKDVHRATIRLLADNTIRVTAQEDNPVRPRYSPVDSFGDKPLKDATGSLVKADDSASFISGAIRIVVNYNPFTVSVSRGDQLIATMNARGLFHIETQLLKPEIQKSEDEGQVEKEQSEEEDVGLSDEDLAKMSWEDDFNSHHDSNPRGPRAISLDITFNGFDKAYGIPEHADTFALKSTTSTDPYRLYNLDVFEYELNNPMALYGSIPYLHALSPDLSVGLMWLNAAETWVDIDYNTKSLVGRVLSSLLSSQDSTPKIDTHWMSESGLLDVFLFLGPSPKDVTRQYSNVFGAAYLPSLFSIAYHQCRWNYNDQKDVEDVDKNFDKYDIPMDVIWLDIEHTDGKRYFTWDGRKFPHSKEMINSLSEKGRNMVTIVDPHIKTDSNYHVYQEGKNYGECSIYVKDKDSNNFEGHCWPGTSSWVDYTSPCARHWWSEQFSYDKYSGSTPHLFTWNDMNEPSVFNGPEVTMHKDNLHAEGWEHRDVHNIYGHYMHRATAEGQILRSGSQSRPFVLSRAFFVGSHRIGPVWTGDNKAEWEHLKMSIPMLLSLNIAGYPFVGADVGGFFHNPNEELLVRWYQAGILQPFLRAHAHIDTRRREPWLFSEETRKLIRDALVVRYQLLPYIYTKFYEASVDNTPILRPLWYSFPHDKSLYENQVDVMFGDSLLSSPVTDAGVGSHTVTLPGDKNTIWYNYFTYSVHAPGPMGINVKLSTIPLYILGGSIVPIKKRLRRSSALMAKDPYTLLVALDPTSKAKGSVYVDDGISFEYKDTNLFSELTFENNALSCSPKGSYRDVAEVERIVIIGLKSEPSSVVYNGSKLVYSYSKLNKVLTIKKPNVNFVNKWTIELVL